MLPLKIYMSTGTIFDTQEKARQMRDILTEKNYPLLYKEVNEGHSWGNWRALIDEPLVYFFGTGK
jgi:enterochelin esterase family protein